MREFRTPFKPLQRGELKCVFDQRGVWEWLVHPDDAARYITDGIVVNGERYDVQKIDDVPALGAVQIRAMQPNRAAGFVEAVAA